MNNTGDILDYSRRLLNDPNTAIWSDDELLVYANDCLKDLALDTQYLEDYRDYALVSGTMRYDRDNLLIAIERVEFDGRFLPMIEANELSNWTANWMFQTGEPIRWFPYGTNQIGYYPTPKWTPSYSTIDKEYGITTMLTVGTDTVTFDQEYGEIVDVDVDTGGYSFFFVDGDAFGMIAWVDENPYTVNHRVCIRSQVLVNDSDVPDLPFWFRRLIVFYTCWKALLRDSPAKDLKMSEFYKGLWNDGFKSFKQLYFKGHRPQGELNGLKPMKWTSRERFYIGGRYYA